MGNRALENRIKKLMELEEQIKALQQQADKVKAEIKEDMEAKGQKEMKVGNYIIRFKTILSSKFDSKSFKAEHEALYSQYMKQTESRRFTVA